MSSAIVSRSQQIYSTSQEVTSTLSKADFWLDMSDTNCYTLTNFYTIASLIDKSASPKSPLTITGTLRYDFISRGLVMNSNSFSLPMAAPSTTAVLAAETIFIVAYQYAASASTYLNPSTAGSRQIRADPQGGSYTRVGSSGVTTFNISPNYSQRFLNTYVYSNGTVTQYFNGCFNGTGAYTFLAAPASQAAANFQGTLFEMIIFNTALNDTQIETINKYLIDKWSIPTTGLIGSPLSVAGCTLWLDGADTSTITYGSGTSIQQWRDKSGNNYHATQNTAAQQPSYDSSQTGVKFTLASTTFMSTTAPVTRTETVFAVVKLPSTGGNIIGSSSSTRGREFRVFAASAAQFTRILVDNVLYYGSTAGGGLLNTTDRYVISYLNSVANAYAETLFNGHQNGINTSAIPYSTTTLASTNLIGVSGSSFNIAAYDGMIHELIIYNSEVSATDRRAITNYLINKWNITVGPNAVRFPFYRTPVFARLFNPLDIPNCLVWLDANDTSTISLVSGTSNITQWNDKTGSNNHAVAGTNPYPVYASNSFNGLGTVRLRGNSDYFLISTNNFTTAAYPSLCYFVVLNLSNVQPKTQGGILSTDSPGIFGRSLGVNAGKYEEEYYNGFNSSLATYTANTWQIASLQFLGTAAATFSLDGTTYAGTASGTGTNTTGLKIGSYTSLGTPAYSDFNVNFDVAEILVYGTVIRNYERQLIEGYLAHKWKLINNLPSTHIYKTIVPVSTIFNPLTLNAFCSLWLDASDRTTLTVSGGYVTQWRDKSGNSYHATGSGNTALQILGNNNNAILFDNTTTFFTGSSTTTMNSTANLTVFVVGTLKTPPTANVNWLRMVSFGDPDYNNNLNVVAFERFSNTNAITIERGTTPANSVAVTVDTPFLGCSILTPTTSALFLNGTSGFSISFTSKGNFGYSLYNIGRFSGSGAGVAGNFVWSGLIGEVVAFNGNLTTVQQQQMEGYLAWKWGIQANLPSTHPYSKFPPI